MPGREVDEGDKESEPPDVVVQAFEVVMVVDLSPSGRDTGEWRSPSAKTTVSAAKAASDLGPNRPKIRWPGCAVPLSLTARAVNLRYACIEQCNTTTL